MGVGIDGRCAEWRAAALLAQRPYEGPDQDAEDDMDPGVAPRFSRVELRSMFQASARQTRTHTCAARTREQRALAVSWTSLAPAAGALGSCLLTHSMSSYIILYAPA